jgi:DNA cross-link repair 1C protein
MSTFNGVVSEFPRIRIDFFRTNPSQPPPLACFLSHIHSDHLQGLESLKAPFVYCSPATRRLLLRMEKYPHRMNFAKGILEVRKQTYRHLQLILKVIPLQTPTEIELGAKERIRVTLFDANHCPGAVMFFIEGDGKAILYTGDVRAESWWVNSIIRNPVLIPYTLGGKRLHCLYLDTTFAAKDDIYQEFPSKATGLHELLHKVHRHPPETIFHFRAWTLGYEDVWVALSAALGSKIHVDEYQSRLYRSLTENNQDGFSVPEAPALNGFQAGNHIQPGCLTADSNGLRLHSCEPGTVCHAKLTKTKDVVWITPILTRSRDGVDVYEIGAGGGGGDLYQTAELDITDSASMEALADLCVQWIKDPAELSLALQRISSAQTYRNSKMSLDDLGLDSDEGISLKELVSRLVSLGDHKSAGKGADGILWVEVSNGAAYSETIHFPYSRHSSYNELRHLVSAFSPRDICACTVDDETWSEKVSMQTLFGDLCSESYFKYDQQLKTRLQGRNGGDEIVDSRKRKREDRHDTQESESRPEAYNRANGSFGMHAAEAGLMNPVNRRRTSEDLSHVTQKASQKLMADVKTSHPVDKQGSHVDQSAHAGVRSSQPASADKLPHVNPVQGPSRIIVTPGGSSFIDLTEHEEPDSPPNARLEAVKSAFEAITRESEMISSNLSRPSHEVTAIQEQNGLSRKPFEIENGLQGTVAEVTDEPESQVSLTTSAFESQPRPDDTQNRDLSGLRLDGTSQHQAELLQHNEHSGNALYAVHQTEAKAKDTTPSLAGQTSTRMYAIKEAYQAARRCLLDGANVGSWEDLSLRSVGRTGHIEEEIEL